MKKFLVLVCLAVIAACVTTPITNKQAFIMIPMGQEIFLGKQAYNQILGEAKESEDKEMTALVERIGRRIAAVSAMPNLDWEFRLIDSKEQNAFALPGGKVAVYTGLLPIARNEAGLATVMSHEIAHVIARHGAQRMTQQLVLSMGLMAASISLEDSNQRNAIMAALGVGIVYGLKLPFSRSNEAEADRIGLIYMARAGYDPKEAARFWKRFSGEKKGSKIPEFLSTHPADQTRITLIGRYLPIATLNYNRLKVKYGLGQTLDFKEDDSASPDRPRPVPGISVETLTRSSPP